MTTKEFIKQHYGEDALFRDWSPWSVEIIINEYAAQQTTDLQKQLADKEAELNNVWAELKNMQPKYDTDLVELRSDVEKWQKDSEHQFRNWQLSKEESDRCKQAYHCLVDNYHKLKNFSDSFHEAIWDLENEAQALMNFCIDRGHLDNEDLPEGQENFNKAVEKSKAVVKHYESFKKTENE